MKMSTMAMYRLRLNRRCLVAIVMTIHCLSSLSSSGNFAMARSTSSSSSSAAISSHSVVRSPIVHRYDRVRRTTSDQRIAELEALMTLVNGRSTAVAHGKLDPFLYGKRKRSSAVGDGVDVIPLRRTSFSSTRDELFPISADDYDDAIDEILNSIDTSYSPEREFNDDDG